MSKFVKGEIVQFTYKHKWYGCLGIVYEVKQKGERIQYLIGVALPQNDNIPDKKGNYLNVQSAFTFCWEDDDELAEVLVEIDRNKDLGYCVFPLYGVKEEV